MPRILACWLLLASIGAATTARASLTSSIHAAVFALGQATSVRAEDPRRTAEDLLSRARQAMDEGKLEIADSLIARAEALNLRYGPVHFGDTPQKARRDLTKQQKSSGKSARLSDKFSPSPADAAATPPDPFAASQKPAEPMSEVQSFSDAKAIAARHVNSARAELARKNLAAAEHHYREAARLGGAFAEAEDSPAKLWSDLRAAGSRVEASHAGAMVHPAAMAGVGDKPFGRGVATAPPEQDELDPLLGKIRAPRSAPQQAAAGDKAPGMEALRAARRALAVGDLRRAVELVNQAETSGETFGDGDSPVQMRGAIETHQALAELHKQAKDSEEYRHRFGQFMLEQSQGLLWHQELDEAERLARAAQASGADFSADAQTPERVLSLIETTRRGGPASGVRNAGLDARDATRNVAAQALAEDDEYGAPPEETPIAAPFVPAEETPAEFDATAAQGPPPADPNANEGADLFELGEAALKNGRGAQALGYFRQAAEFRDQLDPAMQRRLDLHLGRLTGQGNPATELVPPGAPTGAAPAPQLAANALSADVANRLSNARAMAERDPEMAVKMYDEIRQFVDQQSVEAQVKDVLQRRVARSREEAERYLSDNKARLDLETKTAEVREGREAARKHRYEVDDRIAKLVDEHNRLMDEQRYDEAELLVRRAKTLAPDHPIVNQLAVQSKMVRNLRRSMAIRDEKEQGFVDAMRRVDESSIPFDDDKPFQFDEKIWKELVKNRKPLKPGESPMRSPKEVEISQKLKTNVSLEFDNEPLAKVVEYLAKLNGINIVLDQVGLAEEGITTDTPVSIKLEGVMLKSALKLILEELHLNYVIEDEVLKITSEQPGRGKLYKQTYYVADLVIPIPNFVPNSRVGLTAALHDAHQNVGFGQGSLGGPPAQTVLASHNGASNNAAIDPSVMASFGSLSGMPGANSNSGAPLGNGPGGLGGGAMADFDSLIELITTTVQPETWDELGGPGTVQEYQTNLSLVINQTQEVHEEIVELLDQLRRLQDLQVTIEVRFITLNDNFFERMGIDFDFDLDDDTEKPFQVFGKPLNPDAPAGTPTVFDTNDRDHGKGVTVGVQPTGAFSNDLDIPFRQGSFGLAIPQFGGFDPAAGAQLGFAILSDIEAFFVINAAQGDRRSNVLQAPKVTMFNGQTASVSDVSQSPFVVSVVPVVGDFAAAQQPVIVVLNEGTFLSVQAVVTSDRRFVRLTIVPFFSKIGQVNTFTFAGTSSTVEDTSSQGPQDGTTGRTNRRETNSSGTTVQLPTFSFVSVVTTVSVPDGGTVLLGGIKRLSEGRNEFGVPMLNKIPYVNRLFKNVGIGRETQSLMMMVTPRIIIQEEEEELILGTSTTP